MERLHHTAPVTAVCSVPGYTLAGISNTVTILPHGGGAKIMSRKVFARERVHRIIWEPETGRVLVCGGRRVMLTSLAALLDGSAEMQEEVKAPDWVLAAAFWEGDQVVVVGMWNGLFSMEPGGRWMEVGCPERTLLYSATVETGDGGVKVAVGTVFGEVLVWRWADGTSKIERRLRGHEGSVFAVAFAREGEWVASCSDDRTVRLWRGSAGGMEEEEKGVVVNTGFGEAVAGEECLGIGWGHQARPWGVRFLPGRGDGTVRLASIGEDATAKLWRWEGGRELVEARSWTLHRGKHIWSFDFDFEKGLMATGGNDGRVGLLEYKDDAEEMREWGLEEVMAMVGGRIDVGGEGKKKRNKPKDAFKNYAIVDGQRFVVTTVFGQALLYDGTDDSWKSLGAWKGLRNWSVVGAWEGTGVLAIGDGEGSLGIVDIDHDRVWWWDAGGKGKVADIFVGGKDGGVFPFTALKDSLPRLVREHVIKTATRLFPSHHHFHGLVCIDPTFVLSSECRFFG
jgi:WD40 repeat protein